MLIFIPYFKFLNIVHSVELFDDFSRKSVADIFEKFSILDRNDEPNVKIMTKRCGGLKISFPNSFSTR